MDYIPAEDGPCLQWLLGFSQNLSSKPSEYAIAPADAANIAERVAEYELALAESSNFSTRTPAKILVKDQSKAVAVQLARAYAQQIKLNQGVSDAAKVDAGIPLPRSGGYQPRPAPATSPEMSIVAATPGSQTVGFRDSVEPARRGRPVGVAALFLYLAIGDGPETDFSKARMVDGYTRGPIGVAFEPEQNGKTATYWGRWVSAKMEKGPPSLPVSMTIAA